jgi:hypothetical protein
MSAKKRTCCSMVSKAEIGLPAALAWAVSSFSTPLSGS